MSDELNRMSRRQFTALSIAAGVTAATRASGGSAGELIESDVQIRTSDGVCDAALIHPDAGSWPGVLLFTDVFGLRPTMRAMAKRLAAHGYTVLVPNPFYRSTKPPGLSTDIDFTNLKDRAKIDELRKPLSSDAVMHDASGYVEFLDSQAPVQKNAKMGVFGYCMGGPMTLQAAAANPARIGAGASFHGGALVTDKPDSPHRLVPKITGRYYVAVAMNDDERYPDAKPALTDAFKSANLQAKIEVYEACLHGWCVRDSPQPKGKAPIYNDAQAERAWSELVSLFNAALRASQTRRYAATLSPRGRNSVLHSGIEES
jgi:carboxymethylenebutenolidase